MTVTELDERLKKVAVIGAAGKMGSGIALLLLQEMARSAAEKQGCISPDACSLVLVDSNQEGLSKLKSYLRSNLIKYAEKNINALRGYYEKDISLISNEEIIQAFVQGALDSIIMGTDPGLAKNALMVFEAIIEDFEIKSEFFRTLQQISLVEQWYFTNTSSIPIDTLAKSAGLDSKLIGYHFYNPPAVQKLLEVVAPSTIDPQLEDAALELAKRLQKVLVRSNDVAGFIGNGHFIREVVFALQQSKELSEKYKISFEDAATIINTITQKYLLRPMGIFQLVDYVGVDVCANIMQVMSKYLSNSEIQDPLLNKMVQAGVKGGHHPDGTQKNGFFSYKNNMIQAVYSLNKKEYLPLPDELKIESVIGKFPVNISWKSLQSDANREKNIQEYLKGLPQMNTVGGDLAQKILNHSRKVIDELVASKVARNKEDVATVLKQGFFHLYA